MNNANYVGGNQNHNTITFSHHYTSQNEANQIMQEGLLDRYVIGRNIIPYDFNYNENVEVRGNFIIMDGRQERFIVRNIDVKNTISNSLVNNLHNDNRFHIITIRNITVGNNFHVDDIGILIRNMVQNI